MKKQITAVCAAAVMAGMMVSAGAANTVTATPTRDKGQTVYVDNTRVYPTGYNIADNNYFKLRDIGKLVGFGVDYDEATQTVEISTTRTAPSTEGITDTSVSGAVAKVSNQRIAVDGIYVNMKAYQIDGNNYVKLRDVGLQVNFGVNYDAANNRVVISPKLFYGEEPEQTPTMVTDEMLRQWELEMVDRVNEERVKAGVSPLIRDEMCMEFAQFWAQHLATVKFEHSTIADMYAWVKGVDVEDVLEPDGSFFMTEEMGKEIEPFAGLENITGGSTEINNVVERHMNNFMTSEGHRNTLLTKDFTKVGIGYAVGPTGSIYCCQTFSR